MDDEAAFATLFSFKHCSELPRVCVRPVCPACGANVADAQRIESGVCSMPPPCALVVTVSAGRTMRNYGTDTLLHVGITDSSATVHELDEGGLHRGRIWYSCLARSLLDDITGPGAEYFDASLAAHHADEQSLLRLQPYSALDNNCFAYCIRFLNMLRYGACDEHTKDSFATAHIAPLVDKFEAYREQAGLGTPRAASARAALACCDGPGCGRLLASGDRFKCAVCPDYDLCTACWRKGCFSLNHTAEHGMRKL